MLNVIRRFLPSFVRSFLPSDAQALGPVESSPPVDEIRLAWLRVIETLEHHPERYDFFRCYIPERADSPGCLLGLVGRELGMSGHIELVARRLGFLDCGDFYDRMQVIALLPPPPLRYHWNWTHSAATAARKLRCYTGG